jgi:hypothetical protein
MARRSPGEGSVYRRADGLYVGYITLDSGKRRYASSKRKGDLLRKLGDLREQARAGLTIATGRETAGIRY